VLDKNFTQKRVWLGHFPAVTTARHAKPPKLCIMQVNLGY
jgi:hypothetical protein